MLPLNIDVPGGGQSFAGSKFVPSPIRMWPDIYGQVVWQVPPPEHCGPSELINVTFGVLVPSGQQTEYVREQQPGSGQGWNCVLTPRPILETHPCSFTRVIDG
jgi:hypothetical protein